MMVVGLMTAGIDAELVRWLLERAVRNGIAYYKAHPDAPRVDRLGVSYNPDPPSDAVIVVDAELLRPRDVISCGTAAAAYVAHVIAHGVQARVDAPLRRPGEWHAIAVIGSTILRPARTVWDPELELPRAGGQRTRKHG